MIVYTCEDTFEAMMTCIYDAWASKEGHQNIRLKTEPLGTMELFCEYRSVTSDPVKARKVVRSIQQKISSTAYLMVYRCALSDHPDNAAWMGLPFWLQIVVWAVCSVLSIWLIRPHLLHIIKHGADDRVSNADALLGQVGEVSQCIVKGGYGRVKLDGDDWKAEAPSALEDIAEGAKVKIVGRESIILKVEEIVR